MYQLTQDYSQHAVVLEVSYPFVLTRQVELLVDIHCLHCGKTNIPVQTTFTDDI